jgi:hypothetical protein
MDFIQGMQRKHKILNNALLNLCSINSYSNFYNKKKKFGLEIEMIAQYVCLKMIAMPTLQVQRFYY